MIKRFINAINLTLEAWGESMSKWSYDSRSYLNRDGAYWKGYADAVNEFKSSYGDIDQRRKAQISVLKSLAVKKPQAPYTDEPRSKEYIQGFNTMQGKIKFEIQRLTKLTEESK